VKPLYSPVSCPEAGLLILHGGHGSVSQPLPIPWFNNPWPQATPLFKAAVPPSFSALFPFNPNFSEKK